MSKSILIIDTPKSCEKCFGKCRFYYDYIITYAYKSTLTKRHPQCPLQPVEPLLEAIDVLINNGQYYHEDEVNKLHKALKGDE